MQRFDMKHIVTDMGGVIIDLYWAESIQKVIGKNYELDELVQIWMKSKSTSEYDTGKQKDFDEFIRQFLAEFKVNITSEELKQYFMGVVGAPKDGFFEIFNGFKKKGYILSVLSNTNPAHVNFLTEKYDLFRLFDYKFFSHEIGCMKLKA
jgi:FMN phosphatase YigB (HAD superfamily)